jgi:lipopolysaccharide/colanic/teichoic acid biosynthesis glycosyltransferase
MMKRLFDFVFSLLGLTVLSPLLAVIAIFIKIDSKGSVFFRQERIGRHFKPFRIYKFRTMISDSSQQGPSVTVAGDRRVTRMGRFLRKTKIDELPQLINVLKGEMSFVGPRPEVGKYVELFKSDYQKLLSVRPGITDPASIYYADEEGVLSRSADWEREYSSKILPEKIKFASQYVDNHNLLLDLKLILKTIFR